MLNQSILVGRLTKDPEIRETADGKQVSTITLAVARNFKSQETGEYEADFLRCTLWEGMAQNTVQYCKKGSTIAVKARPASTARTGVTPAKMSNAVTIPQNATTLPTDKSIPPEMMTSVNPKA